MLSLAEMPFPRKYVNYAPDVCRCPRCGKAVPRHESRERYYWEPGLAMTMILVATVGCYVCWEHPPATAGPSLIPSPV